MSTSDPVAVQEVSGFRRLATQLRERKAWEAANNQPLCACHPQGLADAWTDAKGIDAKRGYELELQQARGHIESDIVHQMRKLGVPERAIRALLVLDKTRPAIKQVTAWLGEAQRPCIVLLGGNGCGKTVGAALIVKNALLANVGRFQPSGGVQPILTKWMYSSELSSISSFSEADRLWFEECLRARLLVLDEFAQENLHSEALPRLERLIDHRYGSRLRTVITSNATWDVFAKRAGNRIADRLREMANVYECGNESLRRSMK